MENSFISTGKVIFDPSRGSMSKNTKNWCIISVDREITRYYRAWLRTEKHLILEQPAWDAHISVIRGEYLPEQKWKSAARLRNGDHVEFQYEHGDIQVSKDTKGPGHFYWIRVHCPDVDLIRENLNLVTSWKYHHLTIGRTYN
jgi:hypothetical protein